MDGNGSSSPYLSKLEFFQVIFPNPTRDLLIPQKFHTHLPKDLPTLATLISRGKLWEIKMNKKRNNIYFTEGWTEFSKAHNLRKGDLLVFRLERNLVFDVSIFDETFCLKELPSEQPGPHVECVEIEDSVDSNDQASCNEAESEGEREVSDSVHVYEGNPFKEPDPVPSIEKILDSSSDSEDSTDIQDSTKDSSESDTADFTSSEDEKEEKDSSDSSSFGDKRRRIETGKAPRVDKKSTRSQKMAQKKKSVRFSSQLDEIAEGEPEARAKSHSTKRKYDEYEQRQKKTVMEKGSTSRQAQKEKESTRNIPNSSAYNQFEKILTPTMVEISQMRIPREFCEKNGWIKSRAIFLQGKNGNKWPVKLDVKHYASILRKGWINFTRKNHLREGDKCVFKFINQDTLLVEKVASGHDLENNQRASSSVADLNMQHVRPNDNTESDSSMQFERTLTKVMLSDLLVPMKFCAGYGKGNHTIFMKRGLHGEPVGVNLIVTEKGYGRVCAGWLNFTVENRFKIGDTCLFTFESQNTFRVDLKPDPPLELEENEIKQTVRNSHLQHNRMTIPREFCLKYDLITACDMTLQDSEGNEWYVPYSFRSNGELSCRQWHSFSSKNALKLDNKLIFGFISENKLSVRIERK